MPRVATVLVVDDEPDLRFLLRKLLERSGHAVLEAPNGRAALDVLADEGVDVLIVDTTMPVMDGATLISELRAHDGLSATPVIMWSDNPDREIGVEAVFAKPYGGPEIAGAVTRLTQRS